MSDEIEQSDCQLQTDGSSCVIVSSKLHENNVDLIKSYFQKEENGGAGDVEGVIYPLEGDTSKAAVIFLSAKSAHKVCSVRHENYIVQLAHMIFPSLEATIDEQTWHELKNSASAWEYCLEQKGITSSKNRVIKGNWLQIQDAQQTLVQLLAGARNPKGHTALTETTTAEAAGHDNSVAGFQRTNTADPPAATTVKSTSNHKELAGNAVLHAPREGRDTVLPSQPAAVVGDDLNSRKDALENPESVFVKCTLPGPATDIELGYMACKIIRRAAGAYNSISNIRKLDLDEARVSVMSICGSLAELAIIGPTRGSVDAAIVTLDRRLLSVSTEVFPLIVSNLACATPGIPKSTGKGAAVEDTCESLCAAGGDQRLVNYARQMISRTSFSILGVEIRIYSNDITKVHVDAIVNPANQQLRHGGGVALAIANAAGPLFQKLSDSHIKKHGALHISEAVALEASGRIKENGVKFVINAVGPRWSPSQPEDCERLLADAVQNSLREASNNDCRSIAMPAISSGIFGVPIAVCIRAYISGIMGFLEKNETRHLKFIHLVNIDQDTTDSILHGFESQWALRTLKTQHYNS